METVDRLLINANVLTMDAQLHQYPAGAVAVQADKIVAVGPEASVRLNYTAGEVIDCQGKVLMPGLINAHTHVPMTLLRGLADDLRLDVWLMGYMMPVEREFVSPDFVRLGTLLACAEMIRSGVTCFADMYYFEEDIARAAASAGMRAVCSQTIMKYPTPDASSFEESLASAREFIERWKGHPLIIPSVAPHAPYTCTPEILQASTALACEFDVPLHIHLAETSLEVENLRRAEGMPVIPYVKKHNLFEAKVLAAHCVHVDEGEIRSMYRSKVGIAHNPSSNLKLGSGFAPVKRMIEMGANVGIGTDGPASNNDLDMFEEIRLAAFVAKGASGDPTAIPAPTALLMATRLGAQAMHISHLTGSLEPGKRADLIVVDISPLHNSPYFRHDPNSTYAQIVYAGKSTDVTDVMVNGQFLMRDRVLLTLDPANLLASAQEYARRIDAFLIKREQSLLSKLIAIGGAMQEESFEVQAKVRVEDLEPILEAIRQPEIEILRERRYREYDIYFSFEDASQGALRYREDHFIGPNDQISNVRSRLTLIGKPVHNYDQTVLLSRSRYYAPAVHSLRFYREYFKPSAETEIEKERRRFLVHYKDTEFFINLDTIQKPSLGKFLEIKSRTWSRQDANSKAGLVTELLSLLVASNHEVISSDYSELVNS